MADTALPNDIARCDGRRATWSSTSTFAYLRAECQPCLRRTAPRPDRAVMVTPSIFDGKCVQQILQDPQHVQPQ
mgnify:CR=1 FL=1